MIIMFILGDYMSRLSRNLIRRMILSEMEDTVPLPPRKHRGEDKTQQQLLYRKKKNDPFDPDEQTEYTANPPYSFDLPELDDDGNLAFNTFPGNDTIDPIIDLEIDDSYATDDMNFDLEDSYTLRRTDPERQPFTKGFAGITPEFEERERRRKAGELPYQDLPSATIEDFAGAAGMSPDDYRASLVKKVDQLKRDIRESIRRGSSKKVLLRKLVELKACQNLHEQTLRRY